MIKSITRCVLYICILLIWTTGLLIKYTPILNLVDNNGKEYFNCFAVAGISIVIVSCFILFFVGTNKIEKSAVIMIIGFGLAYLISMTPFSHPDEDYHYNSALMISNIILGKNDTMSAEKMYLNTRNYILHNVTDIGYIEEINDLSGKTDNNSTIISFASDRFDRLLYPIYYLSSGFGILVGRLLGLRFTITFWLGEFFNLIMYMFLTLMAMRVYPSMKEIILLVSTIPMNLHQAASFSYDAFLLGISYVFFAYILRLYYETRFIGWKEVLIISGISVLYIPEKAVYGVLILLFWIIPKDRFKNTLDYYLKVIVVTVIPAAWTIASKIAILSDTKNRIMSEEQMKHFQPNHIINDPLNSIIIIIRTIIKNYFGWILQMFGHRMAGLSLFVSTYILYGFMLILTLAVLYFNYKQHKATIMYRIVILIALSGGVFLILLIMLLDSTRFGSRYVSGVQGRYFMPFLLPFIACFGYGKRIISLPKIINENSIFNAWGLLHIGVIINIFYRHTI